MTTQRWYDNPDATLTLASLLAVLGTSSGDSDKKATVAALASLIFADAALTGTPTAPTAAPGTNTDQIATMAAVKAAIDALVASAPGALDTLKELSDALGDDADFAGTMTAALAGKQPLATLLTNLVALTLGADKLIYATGSNTVAAADFTAFARALVAATDAAAARTTLGAAAAADVIPAINAQTGTSYTAVITDRIVTMTNAAANAFTVPPNSDVAFPVGSTLEVWQGGAGQTTIAAGAGVTIKKGASDTLKLLEQEAGCSLRKTDTDTWRLVGKMEPA